MTTIQERLRAIDEEKMYQEPATTFATCQEAADRIDALEVALRFYADPTGDVPDFYSELDFGARAHDALNPPA